MELRVKSLTDQSVRASHCHCDCPARPFVEHGAALTLRLSKKLQRRPGQLIGRNLAGHWIATRPNLWKFKEISWKFQEISWNFQEMSWNFQDMSWNFQEISWKFQDMSWKFQDISWKFQEISWNFQEISLNFQRLGRVAIQWPARFLPISCPGLRCSFLLSRSVRAAPCSTKGLAGQSQWQ